MPPTIHHMHAPVVVSAFDHLVLKCADVETTLAWYVDVLGLQPMRVKEWRNGDVPFPSVRVDAGTIIDLIKGTDLIDGDSTDGHLDHFCLVIEAVDLAGLAASVPFPKRLGKPEEFGSLVLELARNGYFNGQTLRLDGAIRMPPK